MPRQHAGDRRLQPSDQRKVPWRDPSQNVKAVESLGLPDRILPGVDKAIAHVLVGGDCALDRRRQGDSDKNSEPRIPDPIDLYNGMV